MKNCKNALIIIDGSEGAAKMAEEIASVLKGGKVSIKPVDEFKGNDLLPADAFFLGCEKPRPASFAYVEDLFSHINLAGRPCGVFSSGPKKTAEYLAGLLRDSGAVLNPDPLLASSETDVKTWARSVISKSF